MGVDLFFYGVFFALFTRVQSETATSETSGSHVHAQSYNRFIKEQNATVNKKYHGSVSVDDDNVVYKFEHVQVGVHENIQIELSVVGGDYDPALPPLFAVVRTSENIMSFQVPVMIGERLYSDVSRTLCTAPNASEELNTFFIDLSTLSARRYNFTLSTTVIDSSQLKGTGHALLHVSPSQPQVLSYQLKPGEDESHSSVLVKFESDDNYCSIVSVQNAQCPVYDQVDDVAYEGVHQYFTKKAGIVVSRERLKSDWFFIVVIVVPTNVTCDSSDSLYPLSSPFLFMPPAKFPPSPNAHSHISLSTKKSAELYKKRWEDVLRINDKQSKKVTITIVRTGEKEIYFTATVTALVAFGSFYFVFFIYALAQFCKNRALQEQYRRQTLDLDNDCDPGLLDSTVPISVCDSNGVSSSIRDISHSAVNVHSGNSVRSGSAVHRSRAISNKIESSNQDTISSCSSSADGDGNGENYRTAEENLTTADTERLATNHHCTSATGHHHHHKGVVYLSDLARKRSNTLQRKYRLYFWTLLTVAIFYTLPVIYLMISYQLYFDTGNQDFCYYNFWCSQPYSVFASFNSLFSNIGYVMLGVLFFLIVYSKEANFKLRVLIDPDLPNRGIPKHFGIFYAIALALCMEGVMSACYHLCPNGFNFQFDVSFMYIIGGLGTLRMYQSRHPDVNANSHMAFMTFAVVIAISVVGVVFHAQNWFWILFVVCYLLAVFYVTCQVYFISKIKLDWKLFHRMLTFVRREYCVIKPWRHYLPNKPDRFILLTIGNIVNWAIGVLGVIKQPTSFGSLLLSIFIVNLLLYFMFYIIMKLRFKERVHYFTVFLGMFGFCTWISALYFFKESCTNWQLSPAQSRELNKECVLLDFYDNHDIWHFLSAISLFVSFLIVLILDDDLDSRERHNIKVF